MYRSIRILTLCSILGSLMPGMAKHALADEFDLSLPAGAYIQPLGEKSPKYYKDGKAEEIELDRPTWVRVDGRAPVLIVPVANSSSEITLNPPKIEDVLNEQGGKLANRNLGTILGELLSIQNMIRKKQLTQADQTLTDLMKKFPNVTFLKFTKASIESLKGNKSRAIELLNEALEFHPDYEPGSRFLTRLKGGQR